MAVPKEQIASPIPLRRRSEGLEIETLIDGGDDADIKLLFLPDGYTEAELDSFEEVARAHARGLLERVDYSPYSDHISVYLARLPSRDHGISDPAKNTSLDTYFGITWGELGPDAPAGSKGRVRRCTWFSNDEGKERARKLREEVGATTAMILANTDEHGGCGGGDLIVQTNSRSRSPGDLLAHELGHVVFGLADEYAYDRPADLDRCRHNEKPNIGYSLAELPWKDIVTRRGTLTATNELHQHEIGAFEGGNNCLEGAYRAQHTCAMRQSSDRMCAACRRRMDAFFEIDTNYVEESQTECIYRDRGDRQRRKCGDCGWQWCTPDGTWAQGCYAPYDDPSAQCAEGMVCTIGGECEDACGGNCLAGEECGEDGLCYRTCSEDYECGGVCDSNGLCDEPIERCSAGSRRSCSFPGSCGSQFCSEDGRWGECVPSCVY